MPGLSGRHRRSLRIGAGRLGYVRVFARLFSTGFYAAMNLNIKKWKRLLDLDNPNHGLLLAILIYCVDKKGRPVLGKPRPGPDTAHFIEHEAYKDIAPVIPALRELHYVTHYNPE
ncbi:hypothetical protein [Mesorhizobium sp.]|uniref:hypothetical protein n=1 Tax=Mesorhizobium sp. TaxID=1871066 RepID=UPI0025CC31BC|nr:hypothetical protein [Mesorhizobium sp.]